MRNHAGGLTIDSRDGGQIAEVRGRQVASVVGFSRKIRLDRLLSKAASCMEEDEEGKFSFPAYNLQLQGVLPPQLAGGCNRYQERLDLS